MVVIFHCYVEGDISWTELQIIDDEIYGGIKLDGNGIFFSVISLPRKKNLGICFGLVHNRIMTFVLEVTKNPIGSPIFPFSSFRPVNFHFWAEVAELYDVWCIHGWIYPRTQ